MVEQPPIRLCEWSSVDVTELLPSTRHAIAAAAEAWREENSLPDAPVTFGGADGTTLSASHYVGVIEVGACTIEIYPKLDKQLIDAVEVKKDSTASTVMRHLLWMLEVAGYMDLAEADTAQLDVAQVNYYDLFAYLLAKNLLTELERGVMHGYVGVHDNTPAIRGRIDMLQQCTKNWGRCDVHFCRWDEFTPDIPMNRLFKCACRHLQPRVRNPEPALLLANCAALLDEVADVDPYTAVTGARIRWDRSNDRFRRSFDMARRLLAGSAYEMASGGEDVFVFLLDMNHLFESFVTAAVSARFGVSVLEQSSIGHLLSKEDRGYIRQKPDIQWCVGARNWIGDAKYKRLLDPSGQDEEETVAAGDKLGAADVRQLSCYSGIVGRHSTKTPSLAVFYPLVGNETPEIIQYRTWNDSSLCMVPVRLDKVQPPEEAIPSGSWMTATAGPIADRQ